PVDPVTFREAILEVGLDGAPGPDVQVRRQTERETARGGADIFDRHLVRRQRVQVHQLPGILPARCVVGAQGGQGQRLRIHQTASEGVAAQRQEIGCNQKLATIRASDDEQLVERIDRVSHLQQQWTVYGRQLQARNLVTLCNQYDGIAIWQSAGGDREVNVAVVCLGANMGGNNQPGSQRVRALQVRNDNWHFYTGQISFINEWSRELRQIPGCGNTLHTHLQHRAGRQVDPDIFVQQIGTCHTRFARQPELQLIVHDDELGRNSDGVDQPFRVELIQYNAFDLDAVDEHIKIAGLFEHQRGISQLQFQLR